MKVVIDQKSLKDKHAGSKARDDISNILVEKGFVFKQLDFENTNKIWKRLKSIIQEKKQLIQILNEIENYSFIVFQHPLLAFSNTLGRKVKKISANKHFTTSILIHDLDILRFEKFMGICKRSKLTDFIRNEIFYLNCHDFIICHNKKMMYYLEKQGIPSCKLVCLELFDYLIKEINTSSKKMQEKDIKVVNIAGNLDLQKAGYLQYLKKLQCDDYHYELFGVNNTLESNEFIHYNGAFEPDVLPHQFVSGFGLVWDGNSILSCEGIMGNYLKYNNPHKISAYIAGGIPVIVWAESALADFVIENNIGLTINKITDIKPLLISMGDKEYEMMKLNVIKVRDKLIRGEYLINAVLEIEKRRNTDEI